MVRSDSIALVLSKTIQVKPSANNYKLVIAKSGNYLIKVQSSEGFVGQQIIQIRK